MADGGESDQRGFYQIKVQGQLSEDWTDWFGCMTVTSENQGIACPLTTLSGIVADQSALRGILTRIWDLNLALISVVRLDTKPENEANVDSG